MVYRRRDATTSAFTVNNNNNINNQIIGNSSADTSVGMPPYKTHMKLTIFSVSLADYGMYKCVAKNPRGETDGTIRLYGKFNPNNNQILFYTYLYRPEMCELCEPVLNNDRRILFLLRYSCAHMSTESLLQKFTFAPGTMRCIAVMRSGGDRDRRAKCVAFAYIILENIVSIIEVAFFVRHKELMATIRPAQQRTMRMRRERMYRGVHCSSMHTFMMF